jgi:hypothetical protein
MVGRMTDPYTSADAIKSMKMFFIDNQGAWPSDPSGSCKAELVNDAFVVWPDKGQYPTYAGIAMATHPNYDGIVVVQAGNRGIVVSFVPGAKSGEDVKAAFKTMKDVDQYRIAVDSLVHRMILWQREKRADGSLCETSEVEPLSLMSWLASTEKGKAAATVIGCALADLMIQPDRIKSVNASLQQGGIVGDAFTISDSIVTSLIQASAFRAAQTAPEVAPVKRRD